jgi:hypothetical protein
MAPETLDAQIARRRRQERENRLDHILTPLLLVGFFLLAYGAGGKGPADIPRDIGGWFNYIARWYGDTANLHYLVASRLVSPLDGFFLWIGESYFSGSELFYRIGSWFGA